jgi:hypothetical protein
MASLRDSAREMKRELGLLNRHICSKEEHEQFKLAMQEGKLLPEGVYYDETGFFFRYEAEEDRQLGDEFLRLRAVYYLKSIKSTLSTMLAIFIVLLVLSLFIGVWALLS